MTLAHHSFRLEASGESPKGGTWDLLKKYCLAAGDLAQLMNELPKVSTGHEDNGTRKGIKPWNESVRPASSC